MAKLEYTSSLRPRFHGRAIFTGMLALFIVFSLASQDKALADDTKQSEKLTLKMTQTLTKPAAMRAMLKAAIIWVCLTILAQLSSRTTNKQKNSIKKPVMANI